MNNFNKTLLLKFCIDIDNSRYYWNHKLNSILRASIYYYV